MPPKSYREFAASIIETLESLGLQYAIGGSFASSTYGEARTTMDIDISVVLSESDVNKFVEAGAVRPGSQPPSGLRHGNQRHGCAIFARRCHHLQAQVFPHGALAKTPA